jgi:signal transduction histidine kinase
MQSSTERLSTLLSSTLHLSQGILDPSEVNLKPGDITVVLDRAVAQAMPAAEARGVEILLNAEPSLEVLDFDQRLIHEVMAFLLGNACRFAPHGGAVEVRGYWVASGEGFSWGQAGSGDMESYRIDIRDCGPAIPSGSLSTVFDLTENSGGVFDRSEGGLELAMCKLILGAHRGEVCVESGESGTTFSVVLPSRRSWAAAK